MKAIFISKEGKAEKAFSFKEVDTPKPGNNEILIKVEGFGLNFADVMARKGLYRDRPPLPCVVGYDVVGRVEETGSSVQKLVKGDRVTAMTRFGGYAQYAVTDARAAAKIPEDMDCGQAAALTTQYCTAYYSAEEMVRLQEGEHVLIQAAAGGVGTALVQLAKRRGCVIYGTAGSEEKLEFLRSQGVDHPINYRKQDFYDEVRKVVGERGLDVVFESISGASFKKGKKLLGPGGRLVVFGAAGFSGVGNPFSRLMKGLEYGVYHPVSFIMDSKSLLGVNMLRIADHRPEVLERVLNEVVTLTTNGELHPEVGARFRADEIAQAHQFMEDRASIGKIIVNWD